MFTKDYFQFLSLAKWIQSKDAHPVLRSILIFHKNLCPVLPSGSFSSGFSCRNPHAFLSSDVHSHLSSGTISQIGHRPRHFEVSRALTGRQTDRHSLSHTHTHTHTHEYSRIPLNGCSYPRVHLYLHNTQQTRQTNTHAFSGIRTRDPNNQVAADLQRVLHTQSISPSFISYLVRNKIREVPHYEQKNCQFSLSLSHSTWRINLLKPSGFFPYHQV